MWSGAEGQFALTPPEGIPDVSDSGGSFDLGDPGSAEGPLGGSPSLEVGNLEDPSQPSANDEGETPSAGETPSEETPSTYLASMGLNQAVGDYNRAASDLQTSQNQMDSMAQQLDFYNERLRQTFDDLDLPYRRTLQAYDLADFLNDRYLKQMMHVAKQALLEGIADNNQRAQEWVRVWHAIMMKFGAALAGIGMSAVHANSAFSPTEGMLKVRDLQPNPAEERYAQARTQEGEYNNQVNAANRQQERGVFYGDQYSRAERELADAHRRFEEAEAARAEAQEVYDRADEAERAEREERERELGGLNLPLSPSQPEATGAPEVSLPIEDITPPANTPEE